ncbi:hypothetical protein MPTK1_5g19660 [Marchantia polymorpha subsp. ruderalis]|uniref:Uncharacterized protein n=2 Tax=Marchantia polymorpha TaxID=3197 RepID=A0AAF6BK54_MARPO|nr:hypothetical protein MARPO_0134s0024 [Marchantia polymorpha]BBN12388.1 hypothetical protein Mp_5g19660 [Marchantia polymorpha subsp. ruderalis]|eukprot:PTQ29813.1 hypothetical protein MARPO_0134s0024 [Marchantia polymorpha]
MDIQEILGFKLSPATVYFEDGRPLSRVTKHRGAYLNKFRAPADLKTIDFNHDLGSYIPPKIVKRSTSSQGEKKLRIKKKNPLGSTKQVVDTKEKKQEFDALSNASTKTINTLKQDASANECGYSQTSDNEDRISTLSCPKSVPSETIEICTCDVHRHITCEDEKMCQDDFYDPQLSQGWFKKTLQQYEDLQKEISDSSNPWDMNATQEISWKQQYDDGALDESKAYNQRPPELSLSDPELRKRILETLKKSVQKIENLMLALRDEQEKSRRLSIQLQGFLSASKDRTPQPSPPGSRSTSPQ